MRYQILTCLAVVLACDAGQPEPWTSRYGNNRDRGFVGLPSFAHLPAHHCLNEQVDFDIAVVGAPFDGLVTYRPGARFGPRGLRIGSQRSHENAVNLHNMRQPYKSGFKVVDCGDVPMSQFEPTLALEQLQVAYDTLLNSSLASHRPRVVTLGGDHSILLPILRSLHKHYGKIAVIHFDAHLDTYQAPGGNTQDIVTHGSMLLFAAQEGLLAPSMHLGIRMPNLALDDFEVDERCHFRHMTVDDIDEKGIAEVLKQTKDRIADAPVYISLDVDVLDPAFAPATGTPEAGGLTSRELKRLLQGLSGLNIVGADVVELATSYDNQAEITQITAAHMVFEIISAMTAGKPPSNSFIVHRDEV